MNSTEFNLYSDIVFNIFNNECDNINSVLKNIEDIIPGIVIHVMEIDSEQNLYRYSSKKNRLKKTCQRKNRLNSDKSYLDKLIWGIKENNYNRNLFCEKYIPKDYDDDNIFNIYSSHEEKIYSFNFNDKSCGFIYIDISNTREDIINNLEFIEKLIYISIKNRYKKLEYKNNYKKRLCKDIENGIKLNEFKFVYQPKFNMKTNSIVGAEVLIRWKKSNGEIVYPDKFINKLEKYNLIYLIDYYVMYECIKQMDYWFNFMEYKPINIAINLSKSTLMRDDFIEYLNNIIDKYKINLNYLEFEITERENIKLDIEDVNKRIKIIRDLGIKVSLDDFGSENSNISLYMNIDFDVIKIDKSIIDNIGKKDKADYILRYIRNLANHSGAELIAEGIETRDQYKFLLEHGYNTGQGYYFSTPIDVYDFEKKYLNIDT